jgi:phosphate starvation-inducible PhoH-like protein
LEPISQSSKAQAREKRKAAKHAPSGVLTPRNAKQAALLSAFKTYPVVFAIGAAGSGKTYLAARFAQQQLAAKKAGRLVMSRATATAPRHKLGFLPGNDAQKMAPWLVPITSALQDGAGPQELEKLKNEKRLEILPFEHMQGRTIKDGIFLLDEAQNCTFGDLQMFITRVGEDAQLIICGDHEQVVPGIDSGLEETIRMVEMYGLNAAVVMFDENDVVRSETASEWVKAYKRHKQSHGIGMLNAA